MRTKEIQRQIKTPHPIDSLRGVESMFPSVAPNFVVACDVQGLKGRTPLWDPDKHRNKVKNN